eukprot:CAMPEP_0173351956 /NCGR_PEP_ID=MMETSP1144-20121109/15746_1 /TAXON_ID=483371 /ORGANISM="non described non described, Strain CCMP2298" /LENGTH=218 /DNA_ID=CAMNT_0014300109 /DNA_START=40 /DNA_END=693 /DNA_ORIENTATION=-
MNFLPPKPEFVKALEKNLENLQPPPFMRKAEKEDEEEEESPEFLRDVPDEADKKSLFPNINMPGIRNIPKPFRTFMKPVEKDKDKNKDKEKEPSGFFPPSFPTLPTIPSFAPLLPFLQPKARRGVVEGVEVEGGDTNSFLSCGVLLMLVVCVLSVLFSVLDALKGLATGDMSGLRQVPSSLFSLQNLCFLLASALVAHRVAAYVAFAALRHVLRAGLK